jgi:uncharacterized protein YabN with tetrapyrrole methylase and pyrophosphatase domain
MQEYPHLQSTPRNEAEWFSALVSLARYLRTPEGCPWDRKQTALSFARYLKGEAEEYVEACEAGDGAHMAEEWGDSLFVLLASLAAAEESGSFNLNDALRSIHDKMIRRHAHVFGDTEASTPEEVAASWERVKAEERAARQHRDPKGPRHED